MRLLAVAVDFWSKGSMKVNAMSFLPLPFLAAIEVDLVWEFGAECEV